MKKLFAVIVALSLVAVTLSACERKQTAGQQLDKAMADTSKAVSDVAGK